ncbi:hypothetical protein QUA54_23845 [Microcoleus sp. MOSTC5]
MAHRTYENTRGCNCEAGLRSPDGVGPRKLRFYLRSIDPMMLISAKSSSDQQPALTKAPHINRQKEKANARKHFY